MRKIRSDAKLKNLPPDQYEALADWLLAGTPYRVVKKRLQEEFDVSTSNAGLTDFWNECCSAALLTRRQKAVGLADDIAAEASARPGEFDAATIDALKQKAFELAVNPNADPRDVKGLFMLVLKARAQDIDQRTIDLAEKKFADQQARNDQAREKLEHAVKGGGISKQSIAEIEEALKLL